MRVLDSMIGRTPLKTSQTRWSRKLQPPMISPKPTKKSPVMITGKKARLRAKRLTKLPRMRFQKLFKDLHSMMLLTIKLPLREEKDRRKLLLKERSRSLPRELALTLRRSSDVQSFVLWVTSIQERLSSSINWERLMFKPVKPVVSHSKLVQLTSQAKTCRDTCPLFITVNPLILRFPDS